MTGGRQVFRNVTIGSVDAARRAGTTQAYVDGFCLVIGNAAKAARSNTVQSTCVVIPKAVLALE